MEVAQFLSSKCARNWVTIQVSPSTSQEEFFGRFADAIASHGFGRAERLVPPGLAKETQSPEQAKPDPGNSFQIHWRCLAVPLARAPGSTDRGLHGAPAGQHGAEGSSTKEISVSEGKSPEMLESPFDRNIHDPQVATTGIGKVFSRASQANGAKVVHGRHAVEFDESEVESPAGGANSGAQIGDRNGVTATCPKILLRFARDFLTKTGALRPRAIEDRTEEGVKDCVFHLPAPMRRNNREGIAHGFNQYGVHFSGCGHSCAARRANRELPRLCDLEKPLPKGSGRGARFHRRSRQP